MDKETLDLFTDSVQRWAQDHTDLLTQLERDSSLLDTLHQELDALGLLQFLGNEETHHDLEALAAVAYELAQHSASAAVITVQQNMAHWLLFEAKTSAPNKGWLALPIFESIIEWPHQHTWQDIPLLNDASHLLVPALPHNSEDFTLSLVPIDKKNNSTDIKKLGLNAMPQADLLVPANQIKSKQVIAKGANFLQKTQQFWLQLERCFIAIRAGIAKASYTSAYNYAKERYQGGKIIIEHSLIQKMLADMFKEQQIMESAWRSFSSEASVPEILAMALNSAERLPFLCSDGIQIFGGVGYMEDFPQERRYRDAKQIEFLLGHPQARNFALWQQAV